ncbi:MAG: hypothetical protein JWM33_3980 [Caulobacteraceae bacterium]|nr:hypothetical protein [Caulobacteraceae bacterium]
MRLAQKLGLAVSLLGASPALAKPPVWIVRDADSTLVLFGSVHLLPPGLNWRPPALDQALAKADDLWFEIPMDGAAQSQVNEAIMAKGLLPAGQTLSAILSKTTAQRLAKAAAKLNLPMEQLDKMKPWLVDATISVAALRLEDAGAESGVEEAISTSAPASARRQAFETGPGQIDIFDAMPLKDQIASLEDTLNELSSDPAAYDNLVSAWMKGDIKTLEKLGPDEVKKASPGVYKALITDRNAAWIKQIQQRMAGSGETVVVVGAGHLVGKDGLPAKLRALGYKVEGP